MNDDHKQEPLRALDGVRPPNLWSEVTDRLDRAAIPEAHAKPGRPSNRPWMLTAAVLLAVVAIGGGLALAGSDSPSRIITADPRNDDPADMRGRRWQIEQYSRAGGTPITPRGAILEDMIDGTLSLDLTRVDGQLTLSACTDSSAPAELVTSGGRPQLVVGTVSFAATTACTGPSSADSTELEGFVRNLLIEDPQVSFDGSHLVLSGDLGEARFTQRPAPS